MKKKELISLLEGNISLDSKKNYLTRLSQIYTKNGKRKMFFEQYANGSGNELNNKFWSNHSSSRIAFDLYSCLANEPKVTDFEFEYQLPGILSKNKESGIPNMDVYYRINDMVYFVESKFTETPEKKEEKLAQAYFVKEDEYESTSGKKVKYPIIDRFHGEKKIALLFSDFCLNQKTKISTHKENDWFDYKQEICHLFGIIFYGLEKAAQTKINKIDFRNIVYKFDEYEEQFGEKGISPEAQNFIEEGQKLVQEIFDFRKLNIEFSYGYDFTQNIVKELSEKEVFGLSQNRIGEFMKRYYI